MTMQGAHGKRRFALDKVFTLGGIPIRIRSDKPSSLPNYLKRILFASLFLSSISVLFVLAVQKNLPPEVPLFYGLAEGEEQLAYPLWLTIPSLVSLSIILINGVVSYFWKNEFLQQALILTSLAVAILSAITTVKIALLIGSF